MRGLLGPVVGRTVTVQVILEAGLLEPEQVTRVSDITDLNGRVTLAFPTGIRGVGTVHFDVFVDNLALCSSKTYLVDSSVSIHRITWGRLKTKY